MRHLLTGFEFSQDEYLDILDTAAAMKKILRSITRFLQVGVELSCLKSLPLELEQLLSWLSIV